MNPLARFIVDTGLTQTQFAKRFGFNLSTVNDWFHGRRHPSLGAAFRMEKATAGGIPAQAWTAKNGRRAA